MEVVITKSKKPDKNTMPGLMGVLQLRAAKLLALVRKVLQTSPIIKITIGKIDT